MNKYAIIESGIVTNIVLWDGESAWTPPTGSTVVELTADLSASIGDSYENGAFIA